MNYVVLDFVPLPLHHHRLMRVSPQTRLDGDILIGREEQATRLARSLDDVAAGAKRAVLLLGAPGIGKTTLLRRVFRDARARGVLSVLVRVPAAAGLPPRFPLGEVLDGLVDACTEAGINPPERLRRVVDTLTGGTSVEEYAVALPQVVDAFEDVGQSAPVGIFVDDYVWAPPEGTGPLIAALRIAEIPLCFVATARLRGFGDEMPSPLPEPTADLWIDHVEVPGLAPTGVAELAAKLLGGDVLASLADLLYARTLGNPLFIAETIQEWREDGAITRTGGYWGIAERAPTTDARSLREMIVTRLSRLDEQALILCRALAVVAREAEFEELVELAALPRPTLVELLTRLAIEGFVVCDAESSPRYRLAHPLYESTLLAEMGETRRAELSDRFSKTLRRRAAAGAQISAAELAHHAVRSLERPDDLAAILQAAAAEAESAGSFEEAATWYGHLAELTDEPRGLTRAFAGRAAAVIRLDPELSVQLFTYALELEVDQRERAALLHGRARAHRVAGAVEETLSDLQEALALADEAHRFQIRHAIGASYGMQGRLDEAETIFRELVAESTGTPDHAKALGHLSMCALSRGDLVEGAHLAEAALIGCDDDEYRSYLRTNLAWLLLLVGRWEDADSMIELATRHAMTRGDIHDESALTSIAGRAAGWRGDVATAFDKASRARRLASRLGNPADMICATDVLALALMQNDMAGEAAALLDEVLRVDVDGVEPREFSYSYTIFAEASLDAGDLAGARRALARGRHHLKSAGYWAGALDRVEAQIDLACGDPQGASARLQCWVEKPMNILYEQGRVFEVTAQAHATLGDKAGGVERARQALEIFERLAARRPAERMSEWIQSHSVRRAGRPRSTLPGHLTERETEILQLVVFGRTNREIALDLTISLGTAKKHVENVMAKAGVSRRTELVPFAISLGVLTPEALVAGRAALRGPGGARREE